MHSASRVRKPKGIADLINALNQGCTLVQTFRNSDEENGRTVSWSLHPQGFGVESKFVARLFEVEALEPIGDGLFAEFSQQYRWVAGSQEKFSKRTIERLLPELQGVSA